MTRLTIYAATLLALLVGNFAPSFTETGTFTFTTINFPGALATVASGINDRGEIVGVFVDSALGTRGFVDDEGRFTAIDVPGAVATFASGINDHGEIVGAFIDADGSTHGFVDTGGHFTSIDVPGALNTSATGINNRGEIVGTFGSPVGIVVHGFLDRGGNFTTITFPGAVVTNVNGINDREQIVGREFGGNAEPIRPFDFGKPKGFLLSDGVFTSVGPFGSEAFGINDRGEIVGDFINISGFLDRAGNFTSISVPGAPSDTRAIGINNRGQIVGSFADSGFLAVQR
jgi:probable HAF family extracellular repeat protein